jgi:hypothetical protein
MRYYEFLLEYDRSKEIERIEKLPLYQQRIKVDKFDISKLEKADPTPNKNYVS